MTVICGRKMETTFWEDFCIADMYGTRGISDTFRRAFSEWRDYPVYLAELCIVTNHKLWEHFQSGNVAIAKLYEQCWQKCNDYVYGDDSTYSDEDRRTYFRITD